MITEIPFDDKTTAAVRFSGTVKKKDYEFLIPMLEDKIERYGQINLYCEFDDFKGMDVSTLLEDTKFSFRHRNDFKKVAVVGPGTWMQWMTKLGHWFYNADLEYFDPDECEQALTWLKGK